MTDRDDNRTERDNGRPQTIVVPGTERPLEELSDEEFVDEAQQARDLGSASRSCVAIIAVLAVMALLVCVFLLWVAFIR